MPLHVWLPRAHPIAPAPVSALMSGVMIKVAIYALVRVLVDWVGVLPVWFGVLVLAVGALSAVGGVDYALFQHELKRLLALHSIENVGIIVLGIGACLRPARPRRRPVGGVRARRGAPAHAQPRRLQGAALPRRRRVRARGRARSSSTGSAACCGGCRGPAPAFLLGAMAIAGLPPLNGFASEWLTLQALLHVSAYGGVGDRHGRRDRAGRAGGDRGARRLLLRQGRRARPARAAAPRGRRPRRSRRRGRCGARSSSSPAAASCSGVAPGPAVRPARRARAVAGVARRPQLGLHLPGTGSLPTLGIALVLVALTAGARRFCAAGGAPRRRRAGPAASWSSRSSTGRAPGSRSRCGSCSRPCCARSARSPCTARAASSRRSPTAATCRT